MNTYFDPKEKIWRNDTVLRLPRHDLYFGTPVNTPTAGLPLGDGDTGSLLWLEKDGLHIHINKCDLWQDAPAGVTYDDSCYASGREEALTCQKHGGEITVRFHAPVFEYLYQKRFCARLSLADAAAYIQSETPFGSVDVKAFACADTGVFFLRCKIASEDGTAPEISLSRWGSRTLWRWYCQQQFSPETGLDGTEASAEGERLYVTQELNATKFCIGLAVITEDGHVSAQVKNRHCAGLTLARAEEQTFTVLYTVRTGDTVAAAKEACDRALDSALQLGEEAAYARHREQWNAFWNRSQVCIPDDYLENIYYLYLYYMNSESRGAYPPHFTSGLWGFYHDYVPWVYYFHYNLQHLYAPLDAAGHGELAENYYALRKNGLPAFRLYAEKVKQKNGMFVHDVTDRYGRGADYDSLNCTPGAQIALQMWRHWRYTGDETFLNEFALPMMRGAVEFYLSMLQKEDDGLYHIHGTTAYEGNAPTDDTLTDLVMVRALFSAFLPFADEEKAAPLREVLGHLPQPLLLDLELKEDWDGERFLFGVGKGQAPLGEKKVFGIGYRDGAPVRKSYGDPDSEKRGYGFPDIEVSPLYPAGIFGLKDRGTPLFDAMTNQLLLHQPGNEVGHWNMLPVYLARMGMAGEASKAALGMLEGNQGFLNGFNAEVGEPGSFVEAPPAVYTITNTGTKRRSALYPDDFIHFDFETAPILAQAVNDMLLQSHEGVLRLCPALDPGEAVGFRLFAEGGFYVCAQFTETGFVITVESLRGEPCRIVLPQRYAERPLFAYRAAADAGFQQTAIEETLAGPDRVICPAALNAGETLLLCSEPIEALHTETPAPSPANNDRKTLGRVHLGSPHLMTDEA